MDKLLKFAPRSDHWLCRFLNVFGGKHYWMVIGDTIYYPEHVTQPDAPEHRITVEHEKRHLEQFEDYGTFCFLFLYTMFPLPFFLSYFRWKFEREAYMINLKNGATVKEVVDSLKHYGRPWPACRMRKWFEKELAKD